MATGSGTGTPAISGNITQAAVFKIILDRLRQQGAEVVKIDDELQHVLYDLTSRDNFISRLSTVFTVKDTASVAKPDNTKEIFDIVVGSDNAIVEQITTTDYQLRLHRQDPTPTGEPSEYTRRGGLLYLYPTPDAVYTLTIHNSYYHPAGLASIELDKQFNEAIIYGTLSLLWSGQLSAKPQANGLWQQNKTFYEVEITKLMGLNSQPRMVRYNDI